MAFWDDGQTAHPRQSSTFPDCRCISLVFVGVGLVSCPRSMPLKTHFIPLLNGVPFWPQSGLAAVAGCLLATLAFAGKPVQPPPPISVTSFVHDQDASGNNLLFQG